MNISHEHCLLCGSKNPLSMGLRFSRTKKHEVKASFRSNQHLQGYSGMIHGGVITSLLDSAMVNCLFYEGIEAVTAEINVRFIHSVPCISELEISARLEKAFKPLYNLSSTLHFENVLMASATAKFITKDK